MARRNLEVGGLHGILLVDSITEITARDAGAIVVSGSHGGASAARYALAVPILLAVFNDAGVGKNDAGIAGLAMLADAGRAAVAVGHDSARIGEATDTWETGVIRHANAPAKRLGIEIGAAVSVALPALVHRLQSVDGER